jgi:ABC-type lipoprotein release transport system permease subunit
VVKNQKSAELREETKPLAYTPYAQAEDVPPLTFYLLTERGEAALGPDVRRVVRELDSDLPVFRVQTVAARREEAVQLERTVARLAATLAGIATVLAAVGLYGLIGYGVARRTREIGLRLALGAQRGEVFRAILREALTYLAVGLAAGLPVALGLGRFLESQLFGLSARDPVALVAAVAVLALAVVAAAALPARRAARVEPAVALRHQ